MGVALKNRNSFFVVKEIKMKTQFVVMSKEAPKPAKRIWLMRHSIRSDGGHFPESNCSITQEGIVLACDTARTLAVKVPLLNHVFTSPFAHTLETANAITTTAFKQTPVQVTCDLAETLTFRHNNYHNTAIPLKLTEHLAQNGITYPETDEHVKERCEHLLSRLYTLDFTDVLIVSHAGLLQVLMSLLCSGKSVALGYCDFICAERQHNNEWILRK
jgi:broad specificity phosphatase PhoE